MDERHSVSRLSSAFIDWRTSFRVFGASPVTSWISSGHVAKKERCRQSMSPRHQRAVAQVAQQYQFEIPPLIPSSAYSYVVRTAN